MRNTTTTSTIDETAAEFWRHVAATFGIEVDAATDAVIRDGASALAVVTALLPTASDEERHEVLWALGEHERRAVRSPCCSPAAA